MRLQEVMWPNKYILVALGLWPMRPNTTLPRRLFTHFRLTLSLLAVLCLLVPEVMTVTNHWGDVDILGDLGSLIVIHAQLTLKILYCFFCHQNFRSMYQHLKDFWDISDDPEELRHHEQFGKMAKLATVIFTVMCLSNMICFIATAFVISLKNRREINEGLRNRPLFIEIDYPFNTQGTPIYELVFIWQSVCGIVVIFAVVGVDCCAMVFIVHVSAQFRLIAARFHTIGRKMSEQTIMQNDQELRAEVGKCVVQHQSTIKVAEELNALLSPVIFCQIMSSGLEICLSGYAVIEGDGSVAVIVKFLVLFMSLLTQLIIWCAPSELIIQESTAIAEVIYYEVPWFRLTPSLRRDLGFVIMRAQKACHVSALYQVMSIRRITEVFNAAGSYMALLRRMKKSKMSF